MTNGRCAGPGQLDGRSCGQSCRSSPRFVSARILTSIQTSHGFGVSRGQGRESIGMPNGQWHTSLFILQQGGFGNALSNLAGPLAQMTLGWSSSRHGGRTPEASATCGPSSTCPATSTTWFLFAILTHLSSCHSFSISKKRYTSVKRRRRPRKYCQQHYKPIQVPPSRLRGINKHAARNRSVGRRQSNVHDGSAVPGSPPRR